MAAKAARRSARERYAVGRTRANVTTAVRHVVLDAEVFRRENLSFDSARFRKLAELVEENEIEIHITDVVDQEIRRAIAEQVKAGLQILRDEPTRRALNVLARGAVPKLKELLKELDDAEIVQSLNQEFDDLLDRLDANVINTDNVPVKEVRERYFRNTPPFGHRADKKHEFPDAISVVAIEAWAAQQTESVVVVSGDKGIADAVKAMKGVTHASELRQVIDFLLRLLEVVDDPDALLRVKESEIQARVKDHFEELGFYIDGEWGEVIEVIVRSVKLGTAYLADRKGDKVTLEFDVEVKYTAELSFNDPERTAYDSETGGTYVLGSVSKTVRDSTWLEGDVEIIIDVHDISQSTVESVYLPAADIGVSPPPDPDYK